MLVPRDCHFASLWLCPDPSVSVHRSLPILTLFSHPSPEKNATKKHHSFLCYVSKCIRYVELCCSYTRKLPHF